MILHDPFKSLEKGPIRTTIISIYLRSIMLVVSALTLGFQMNSFHAHQQGALGLWAHEAVLLVWVSVTLTLLVPYPLPIGTLLTTLKGTKIYWSSLLGDLNLLLGSVKWILIARSWTIFNQVETIWKHFRLAVHIWLILFTLKANYIWCERKMEFRNVDVLFMNFHSEDVGHLFSFLVPQFTHQLAKDHSLSSKKHML